MDKMISLYSRYLSEICRCYADENGNRPCDNGAVSRCLGQRKTKKRYRR